MSGWNRDMDKMEWGAGPVLVWHEPSRAPFVIYPRHSTVDTTTDIVYTGWYSAVHLPATTPTT